ncbi:M4 family metallopeptidase [Arsenicicoccus sp. UBA7492]|uniref:M4 family metallopeptidase n=1 Tax=Arsenicicoccus sp. UBA7492 TaxID=1946057 RepID=UPI00257DFA5E|nr:M4 family metallopeptidase [Arsenicicoccus sp. UBA7492]
MPTAPAQLPAPVLPRCCGIVPPHLLRHIAEDAPERRAVEAARHTLQHDTRKRSTREVRTTRPEPRLPGAIGLRDSRTRHTTPAAPQPGSPSQPATLKPDRRLHDARHGTTLPGQLVRSEDDPPTKDESVTEAYDGLGATYRLLADVYGRGSLDGRGLTLVATVHYDRDYSNAFWDGEQMVFGDGDGVYFASFTDSIDVMGHELAHGITQFTAGLTYVGQSGALNESISDVIGSLTKQHSLGQTADQADWLIGAGIFTPKVHGVALRSMKAPGTAYDDPALGKDPQPGSMEDYVDLPHDSDNDNGGVHINSGIPNRAFYLAAAALGGHAWERAGQVWWDVLTAAHGVRIPQDCDFARFARATLDAAAARYGADSEESTAVAQAWQQVGVEPATGKDSDD